MTAAMSDRQALLRRRRPGARPLYARRLQQFDVVHPAGCALEVLEAPEEVAVMRPRLEDHPRIVGRWVALVRVRVIDEYPNGVTFERDLLLDPLREVLASRLPEHR